MEFESVLPISGDTNMVAPVMGAHLLRIEPFLNVKS